MSKSAIVEADGRSAFTRAVVRAARSFIVSLKARGEMRDDPSKAYFEGFLAGAQIGANWVDSSAKTFDERVAAYTLRNAGKTKLDHSDY